jgi:phage shock protein PspC (stress-responsive transcriptional regulator)
MTILNKIFKRQFALIEQGAELEGVLAGLAYSMEKPVWIIRTIVILLGLFNWSIGLMMIVSYVVLSYYAPKWNKDPVDYKMVCE